MVRVVFAFFTALFLITACASSQSRQDVAETSANTRADADTLTANTSREAQQGLDDAVLSPLSDLNLRREYIPNEIASYESPYGLMDDQSCESIEQEVTTLDLVLGSDIDLILYYKAQGDEEERQLSDRASGFAIGQIASEASGIIPFRGIVRSVTGASSHQQKVDAAYQTAFLRRSYLKGLGSGLGCTYPAAPLRVNLEPELPDGQTSAEGE